MNYQMWSDDKILRVLAESDRERIRLTQLILDLRETLERRQLEEIALEDENE